MSLPRTACLITAYVLGVGACVAILYPRVYQLLIWLGY